MADNWMGTVESGLMDAAKGAAVGTGVFPGVGTVIGGIAGLATGLLPSLLPSSTQDVIAAAARAVTGVTDEAKQVEILSNSPGASEDFKAQMMQLNNERVANQAAAAQAMQAAALDDVQHAREASVAAAAGGGAAKWGTAVVSIVLLSAWVGSMLANYFGMPPLVTDDAATLRNLALAVSGYWIGSSNGSTYKTAIMASKR